MYVGLPVAFWTLAQTPMATINKEKVWVGKGEKPQKDLNQIAHVADYLFSLFSYGCCYNLVVLTFCLNFFSISLRSKLATKWVIQVMQQHFGLITFERKDGFFMVFLHYKRIEICLTVRKTYWNYLRHSNNHPYGFILVCLVQTEHGGKSAAIALSDPDLAS